MLDWMGEHGGMIGLVTGVSILTILASLIGAPIVLARIPADYFNHEKRPHEQSHAPWLHWTLLIGRNALGWLLVLGGIAMLALPGQGLLTVLVGLMLVDFPGKYRAQRWLVCRKKVRAAIDWIRRKTGRPPLVVSHCGPEAA